MAAPWRIQLLGGLRATQGERSLTHFRTHKTGLLLAYLAYYPRRAHPREELMELLWPGCDLRTGRNNLRVALSALRHQLEPSETPAADARRGGGAVLVADHDGVQLNPVACTTDVAAFEGLLAAVHARNRQLSDSERVERLTEAVDLYQGELLPGCYEAWVLSERQRLAEAYLQALRQLSVLWERAGDLPVAMQWARRAVCADPLSEEAQECLIRLFAAAGEPDAALRQYRELESLLEREWGLAPGPELRELAHSLERHNAAPSDGSPAGQPGSLPLRGGPPADREPGGREPAASSEGRWLVDARAKAVREALPTEFWSAPAGKLPRQLTRFFGREAEIARLLALLYPRNEERGMGDEEQPGMPHPSWLVPHSSSLITLTGPGGAGKSRLALAVAVRLREAARDRVAGATLGGRCWFVPLQDITDPCLIPDRVRAALQLPRSAHIEPLQQVVAFLSQQPSLLLLDNFEHLINGGAVIVRTLLEQVRMLICLVTSRQRLGLAGEQEFPVAPLPVPVDGCWSMVDGPTKTDPSEPLTINHPLSTLLQCPSVALFLDRARAVHPDFELTEANAAAIAALCRGLEGLPLALELAAARAGVLAPAQMLARLSRRFELLTTRQRDVAPRHRSLRAALDWSYQLLSPELQRFFARLSIFCGGFTLEAAEAVCGEEQGVQGFRSSGVREGPPEPLNTRTPEPLTLDHLDQLRESALVLAEPRPLVLRFRMLETLREYAAEQLSREETAELARRHLSYYVTLAEAAEPELTGPDQATWLERLELELPNLRAAMERAAETGAIEEGLRLGGELGRFWILRGYAPEWGRRLEGMLLRPEAAGPSPARARALYTAGLMIFWGRDAQAALPLVEESLSIERQLGEWRGIARCLNLLGLIAYFRGDTQVGRSLLEEGLRVSREIGDLRAIASTLLNLATLAGAEEDWVARDRSQEESLGLLRTVGDKWQLSILLSNMGHQAWDRGELDAARTLYTESLALERELRNRGGIAFQLQNLGKIALVQHNYAEARARFEETLAITRQLAEPLGEAWALFYLGLVAHEVGDRQRALWLCRQSLDLFRQQKRQKDIVVWLEQLAPLAAEIGHGATPGALADADTPCPGSDDPRPDSSAAASLPAVILQEWAVRLLRAAAALRAAAGEPYTPSEQRERAQQLAALRAALGESAFATAWHEGQTQPWEQAAAFIFAPEPEEPDQHHEPSPPG